MVFSSQVKEKFMARGRPSKKSVILDAAQHLFAQHGYQGTAIDLVVRKAGVSKPTVYNNFPSKQALLQSLITRQLETTNKRQQVLLTNGGSITDNLHTLFQQIIEDPFELALYRIYYGEPYKLNHETLALLNTMQQTTVQNCHAIITPATHCRARLQTITSLYQQSILMNALAMTKTFSADELSTQIQVLELIHKTQV